METRGGPCARVWTLVGGDLVDPSVVGAVEDEAVPRVEECAGFIGAYGLVDRSARTMMSIDLWEDEQAMAASEAVLDRISSAVSALSGAESATKRHYEVVHSRPSSAAGGAFAAPPEQVLGARVVVVDGGSLAPDEVLDSLITYQATYLPQVPGCLSSLLLLDRSGPTLMGLVVWTDPEAARRTADQTAELAEDIARMTGADSGTAQVYEVVVSMPTTLAYPT